MHNPEPGPKSGRAALLSAGLAVLMIGCAGLFFLTSAGDLAAFVDDALDMVVRVVPAGFSLRDAVAWFLVFEGAVWLLAAAAHLALRLPGIEHGPEAEELRQQLRANLSSQDNLVAEKALGALKVGVIKRAFTFAAMGVGSLVFASLLFSGIFNF